MAGLVPDTYVPIAQHIFRSLGDSPFTTEANVADAVWRAANDVTGQFCFPAGADAIALSKLH